MLQDFLRKTLTPAGIASAYDNPGEEETQGSPGKEDQAKNAESLRKYFQNSIFQKVGRESKNICQTSEMNRLSPLWGPVSALADHLKLQ